MDMGWYDPAAMWLILGCGAFVAIAFVVMGGLDNSEEVMRRQTLDHAKGCVRNHMTYEVTDGKVLEQARREVEEERRQRR